MKHIEQCDGNETSTGAYFDELVADLKRRAALWDGSTNQEPSVMNNE